MRLLELLLGRPLRSDEETVERIGVLTAIPVLGLDALASASYGPEAALTVLIPLGPSAPVWVRPIALAIVGLLLLVALSYAQTLPAYPNGGGPFTVAKENLGRTPGLLAAAALCTDYVLNVAVAISAGIGAIASAEPRLLPHTLPLCLGVLTLLTLVNLRGVRESGLVFLVPTYLFVAAVAGRSWFYYLTMGAVFSVLALSANTSFADFPRVCRLLALDEYLPPGFAHRGRRLVYSRGIVTLALLAAALLIAFRGITDRLIPLFAVGAFLAFTLSQTGMVQHWRRVGGPGARRSLLLN